MTRLAIEVKNLQTHFITSEGVAKAVDNISFSLRPGGVLGIVGESGSGKSMTAMSIMRLVQPPGRIVSGQVLFNGRDLLSTSDAEMRRLRGNKIVMIFQNPFSTLDPVLRIGSQMIETVVAHANVSHQEARNRARDALGMVGISSPEERLDCYPHEFSGGMRQRVAIAIALLHRPELIIADEPTTALDVTIQAQILATVQTLIRTINSSLIWISHDLSVVSGLATDVAVMYAGRIVETGNVRTVLDHPEHPYTQGLIASLPRGNSGKRRLYQIPGITPSLLALPGGCSFRERCTRAHPDCRQVPRLAARGMDHHCACHFPGRPI